MVTKIGPYLCLGRKKSNSRRLALAWRADWRLQVCLNISVPHPQTHPAINEKINLLLLINAI